MPITIEQIAEHMLYKLNASLVQNVEVLTWVLEGNGWTDLQIVVPALKDSIPHLLP